MLGKHVGVTDGAVGIPVVELDDVIGAEMLRRRVGGNGVADNRDEVVAGEVGRSEAVLRVVGVHGIGEAVSEHRPVPTVDRDRVLRDGLADERAIFKLAHPRLEIVTQAKCLIRAVLGNVWPEYRAKGWTDIRATGTQ
jgi:hypothetical protein